MVRAGGIRGGTRRRQIRAARSIVLGGARGSCRGIYSNAGRVRAVKGGAKVVVTVGWRVKLDRGLGSRLGLVGLAWRTRQTLNIIVNGALLKRGLLPGGGYNLGGGPVELGASGSSGGGVIGARGSMDVSVALRYVRRGVVIQSTPSQRLFLEVARGRSTGGPSGGCRVIIGDVVWRRRWTKALPGLALATRR
jgi:hypothetical protein